MERAAQLDVEAYLKVMREQMESTFRAVAEAVNRAPDGAWINGSEMAVRDLFAEMRQAAFEKALQMRVDAAQAAFFPGGPVDRPTPGEQGV